MHLRVHISMFLLLALSAGYSAVATGSLLRGVALWLALCAAIAVRESARAIAATYFGLPLRALFLMPVGGVMALAPRQGGLPTKETGAITAVGSAANFGVAALLLGFAYGVDPHVRLVSQPWITIEHILRSTVWLQIIVGVVNLLPSASLPSRRVVRSAPAAPPQGAATSAATAMSRARAMFGVGTALALALVVAGIVFGLLWPVLLGLTILLTSTLNRVASVGSTEAMTVEVRDVMLTEFKPLNASSTIRDGLRVATHSVQDVFPVLRGERLVGWVSRAALATRLRLEGDGFLQGTMQRSLHTAEPGEKIGDALRRATAMGAGEFIPVVEDGAMVGFLTPGSLERAVGQLQLTRAVAERDSQ